MKNADGTYTLTLTAAEQRVIDRVAAWWDDPSNPAPTTSEDTIRWLLTAAGQRATRKLRANDAAAIAKAFDASAQATKTNVASTLGVTLQG